MGGALTQSVVTGGVVYPAGTAETDELRAKIPNPAFWGDDAPAAEDAPAAVVTVKLEDSEEFREYVAKVGQVVQELTDQKAELEQKVADLTAELEQKVADLTAELEAERATGQDDKTPVEGKYDGLDVDQLKAEIDKRNEGREDSAKLSKRGGVDTLVAALVADDEN